MALNAYLVILKTKCVAIGNGYYGSRQVVEVYHKLTGCQIIGLEDLEALQEGDVIHLETLVNPNGKASSIKYSADKPHTAAHTWWGLTFGPRVSKTPFPYALILSCVAAQNTHYDLLCEYYLFHQQKKKRDSRYYATSVLYSGLSLIIRRHDLDVFISYGDSQL